MRVAEVSDEGGAFSLGVFYVLIQVIAMALMGFITWKSNKNQKPKKTTKRTSKKK